MRMMDYVMDLDDDGYKVISRTPNRHACFPQITFPIKLVVLRCWQEKGYKNTDITELIDIQSCTDDIDFWSDYQDIVHGKCKEWILVEFQPLFSGIDLTYLNLDTGQEKTITVDLIGKGIREMYLNFYVPHSDGKPDTQYEFRLDRVKDTNGKKWTYYGSCAEFTPDSYFLMAYSPENREDPSDPIPKHVRITEYADF